MSGIAPSGASASAWYLLTNLAVGFGIAADAMVATISRFHRFKTLPDAVRWASAIGVTHVLFPLAGFIGGWYAAKKTGVSVLIYGAGAVLMAWFITTVLHEAIGLTCKDDEEEIGWFTRVLQRYSPFWAAVWAVSVDALVSGPGKTAATAHWSEWEVWLSFPIVGAIVFGLVLASAYPAVLLHRRWLSGTATSSRGLGRFFTIGTWTEIVIFVYFGLLAVRETLGALSIPIALPWVFGVAALVALVLYAGLGSRLCEAQMQAARDALAPPLPAADAAGGGK